MSVINMTPGVLHDGLFRVAFDLREIRKEFENLEKLLGYEPDRS